MTTNTINDIKETEGKKDYAVPFLMVSLFTILLASLSMITGNRLSTLQAQHQQSLFETASADADSRKKTQVALDSANKALTEEKKINNQLKKKLATAVKELKTAKADLKNTKKMIDDMQSSAENEPSSIPSPDPTDALSSTSAKNEQSQELRN